MMGESSTFTTRKEIRDLVNLDRFSKYLRNFEKRSKLTKNSDFFARGEHATLSHQFQQRQYFNRAKFSVNILQFLKDAVITVGVSFRLCSSFSVINLLLTSRWQAKLWHITTIIIHIALAGQIIRRTNSGASSRAISSINSCWTCV